MDAFVADELVAGLDPGGHDFAEFFRSSTLSLTVARWPAGSVDGQEPGSRAASSAYSSDPILPASRLIETRG